MKSSFVVALLLFSLPVASDSDSPQAKDLVKRTVIQGTDEIANLSEPNVRPPIAAPVHYDDTVVILADDRGVGCVTFHNSPATESGLSATLNVVGYRYRYRSHDGTETTGRGYLYEKYSKVVDGDKSVVMNEGGKLKMVVGHFQVVWSEGGSKQGWLYYVPKELTLQFAGARNYEKLDLSRFAQ